MLKRTTPIARHSRLKRAGPRTKAWDAERRRLKPIFERAGITYCECRYPGCWGEVDGFAHSKKRHEWSESGDISEVIAACNICHRKLDEGMTHAEMLVEVRRIIAARNADYIDFAQEGLGLTRF